MLNALRSFPDLKPGPRRRQDSDAAVRPALRLTVVFVMLCLPLLAVSARLVQLTLAGGAEPFRHASAANPAESAFVRWEPIPAPCGRIVTADGVTLAEDRPVFRLQVHYRWLQSPPDPDWLTATARELLRSGGVPRATREDSSNASPSDLDRARELAERMHETLWVRLAETLQRPRDELEGQRRDIQRRIERMRQRILAAKRAPAAPPTPPGTHDLAALWRRIVANVTETRRSAETVTLQEELQYHTVAEDIPRDAAIKIQSRPDLFPGTRVTTAWKRVYPRGRLAAHWIGVRTELRAEDMAAFGRDRLFPAAERLSIPDSVLSAAGRTVGRSGIERYYDADLAGSPGFRKVYYNAYGEVVREETVVAPRRGRDVRLNVLADLQAVCERLLDERIPRPEVQSVSRSSTRVRPHWESDPTGGAIVVMETLTGRVLAAASAPGFDLSATIAADASRQAVYAADDRHPFVNRATQMAIAPGSSFKILTALAGLQARAPGGDAFFCRGYLDAGHPDRYRCYVYRHFGVGHGVLDFETAFAKSCNVYFYSLGERLGARTLWLWAHRFGFGAPTGIDLPHESSGALPSPLPPAGGARAVSPPDDHPPAATQSSRGGSNASVFGQQPLQNAFAMPGVAVKQRGPSEPQWHRADTLGLAIGQGRLAVTPLQMARLVAAIANGGRLVQPRLAQSGKAAPESIGTALRRTSKLPVASTVVGADLGLDPKSLERIRKAMFAVVNHRGGTGYRYARSDKVVICGKTGTAQVANGGDHAWFVGYFPADEPRFAFAVVLEHGGSGGRDAGPLARELAEYVWEHFANPAAQ